VNNKHLRILLAVFLLLGMTVFSFYPSLDNGFTNWDDPGHLLENDVVKELSTANLKRIFSSYIGENYYPFTILSYAIEYHFSGLNPKIYHATNLILHLLNVLLVYWLIFLMTKRHIAAWIVAFLFAVHPTNVEPVAWISSRKDVLFSVFYLGALISYVFYLKRPLQQRKFFWFSLILFVFSFLSKPVAASFPFLLLVFDYYFERKWEKKVFLEKVPFLIIAIIFGIVAYIAQIVVGPYQGTTTSSVLERFLFVTYGLVIFPFKFIVPLPLSSFYPYPEKVNNVLPLIYNFSPAIVALMIMIVWRTAQRTKTIVFGFLFFLASIFFILRFYPVGGFIIADRYTYLPYIGLSFIIAQGIVWLLDNKALWARRVKPMVCILLFIYLSGLSVLSWQRCQVWKDSLTLWTDVIDQYPRLVIAYHYRGRARYDLHQYDLAIEIKLWSLNRIMPKDITAEGRPTVK